MSDLTDEEAARAVKEVQKEWAVDISALVQSSNNVLAVAPEMLKHSEPETLYRLQDDLSELLDAVAGEIQEREKDDDGPIADNEILEELNEVVQVVRFAARTRFNRHFESTPVLPEKKTEKVGMYL